MGLGIVTASQLLIATASIWFFYVHYPPFETFGYYLNYAELYIVILLFVQIITYTIVNPVPLVRLLPRLLLGYGTGILLTSFIIYMFGAPFAFRKTSMLTHLLTIEIFIPYNILYENMDSIRNTNILSATPVQQFLFLTSVGAIIGCWLGAFPIPLDWDRVWQEWPLSCVYGVLLGKLAGVLVATLLIPAFLHRKKNQ